MISINEIADKIGMSSVTVRKRLRQNGNKCINGLYHVKAINSIRKINSHLMNNDKRILLIQYWIANNKPTMYSVTKDLGLSYFVVNKIINDYKKDECLIIKSKL